MRRFLPLLALLPFSACAADLDFVRIQRLAVGGEAAEGRTVVSADPSLTIAVKIQDDATDFNTFDLMRLVVNGVDRTTETTMGGEYAVLTIDPPPIGAPQVVELYTHLGTEPIDTATYEATPYLGPTLAGVAPDSARAGAQVTISGSGFGGGPLRVFFGGVEGTVDASTPASITATVPLGADPGVLLVLVGAEAARGLVAFQPLDDADQPVPRPTAIRLHYAAPGSGTVETIVTVAGLNFTDEALPRFNGIYSSRVFNVQTVNLPPVGDVTTAYAVVYPNTPAGAATLLLREDGDSNALPFTVAE